MMQKKTNKLAFIKNKVILPVFSFLLLSFVGPTDWLTDFSKAKTEAASAHKYILLNFSGSDWCGPCMRMRKEVFESAAFKSVADQNLVLLNADFPRQKKNQLSKDQQNLNDNLAEIYNSKGIFPYTLLLNEEGKVIYTWEGLPKEGVQKFVQQLNELLHAH